MKAGIIGEDCLRSNLRRLAKLPLPFTYEAAGTPLTATGSSPFRVSGAKTAMRRFVWISNWKIDRVVRGGIRDCRAVVRKAC